MKEITLHTSYHIAEIKELKPNIQELITAAKIATTHSYAPYSGFQVGAAVLLEDGKIITGSNQENAAYPSGCCAERIAMFAANHQHPLTPVIAIAIAAHNSEDFVNYITPCGSCRQVLLETENRFGNDIKVYLYGNDKVICINSIKDLLPFQFDAKQMKKSPKLTS